MLAVSYAISLNVISRQKLYRNPEILLLVLIIGTDKKIIIHFLLFTYMILLSVIIIQIAIALLLSINSKKKIIIIVYNKKNVSFDISLRQIVIEYTECLITLIVVISAHLLQCEAVEERCNFLHVNPCFCRNSQEAFYRRTVQRRYRCPTTYDRKFLAPGAERAA